MCPLQVRSAEGFSLRGGLEKTEKVLSLKGMWFLLTPLNVESRHCLSEKEEISGYVFWQRLSLNEIPKDQKFREAKSQPTFILKMRMQFYTFEYFIFLSVYERLVI